MKRGQSLLLVPFCLLLLAASPRSTPPLRIAAPEPDLRQIRWIRDKGMALLPNGQEAELTLNAKYQQQAEQLLNKAHALAAAAIVIDIKTSKVLVWAHTSTTGANLLLTADTPSASLFKIVTTAALLERTRVTPRWEICTAGGEHAISLAHLEAPRVGVADCGPFWQALGFSRNAAYAQLTARYLDADKLGLLGARFGFNQPLFFDSPLALGALNLPSGPLELARTALGFQNSTLSLLGATELTHVVALGGDSSWIKIVESAPGYQASPEPEIVSRVLSRTTAKRLRTMLEVTIHSGTARAAFTDGDGKNYLGDVRAAGKTGTLDLGPKGPTASWFSGFAPALNPEIVVGVLLHNDRLWHRKANEVARDLFRIHFANSGTRGVTSPFASAAPLAARPTPPLRPTAATLSSAQRQHPYPSDRHSPSR